MGGLTALIIRSLAFAETHDLHSTSSWDGGEWGGGGGGGGAFSGLFYNPLKARAIVNIDQMHIRFVIASLKATLTPLFKGFTIVMNRSAL